LQDGSSMPDIQAKLKFLRMPASYGDTRQQQRMH
jgi:hypothetical protein